MKRNYKNRLDKIEQKLEDKRYYEITFIQINGLYEGYDRIRGKQYKDIDEQEFKEVSKELEARGVEVNLINIVRAKEQGYK